MKKIYFIFCIAALFVFFLFLPNISYAQNTGCCYYDDLDYCENVGKEQEAQYGQDAKTLCKGTYFPDKVCNNKTSCQDPKCPPNKLCLQVPFPGSDIVEKADAKTIFPEYIRVMYRFAIWIAITLGIFMMMVGGFQWLTAGGSPDRVGKAKGYISNAIIGIIIALFSFIILQTINPRLVELTLPGINGPELGELKGNSCCYNSQSREAVIDALLEEGKTCKDLEPLYGPGWIECSQGSACACELDYRPRPGEKPPFRCANGLSQEKCNSFNPPIKNCVYYAGTVCEELRLRGKIEAYTPL